MTEIEAGLLEMLEKARAGEIDSVYIIATRKNVASGGTAYLKAEGLVYERNEVLRDALRLTWLQGMRDFGWSKLGVDQEPIADQIEKLKSVRAPYGSKKK